MKTVGISCFASLSHPDGTLQVSAFSPSPVLYPLGTHLQLPPILLRYFVCGALAEASSSGELEKATQASKQEATEVTKTEEANSSHNPDLN